MTSPTGTQLTSGDPHQPRAQSHARTTPRALGIAVSLLSLAAVVWWVAHQEAPTFPSSAQELAVLAFALVTHASTILLRGWRWHVILRRVGIVHQEVDAFGLVAVGYMGNVVLPARGGELLRVLLLHERSSGSRREILGSIIAERLLDVISLVFLLALVTLAGTAGTPAGVAPAIGGLAAIAVGAIVLAIYLHLRRRGRFETFAAKVRPVARASKPLLSPTGAGLLALSAGIWLLEGFVFALVAHSVGVDLSLLEGAFLVVIANFFALIPAAPGYVGTYDAAVLFGLNALGVPNDAAIGTAILARLVAFVPVTIAGLILLVTRYGGFGMLRRAEESA